jgi:TetR/AcrR family transcriptional repressor of nem operon
MGQLPTTAKGRQTRLRIVTAAAHVVAEKGALGASLDDVGIRAAASRSQIYHYFDDKSDLLRSVADATIAAVLDAQCDLFAGLDSWGGLVRWADALVDLQVQLGGRGGCPIANLLGQAGERDDDLRSVLASGFDRWEASIRSGLVAMVAAGELRPDTDTAWLAASTLASLQGGLVLTQARRDPTALRQALDGALMLIGTFRSTAAPAPRAGSAAESPRSAMAIAGFERAHADDR